MEQKLPGPERVVVGAVALRVRADVETQEPGLVPLDPGVRLLQVRAAVPERLDLGPLEDEPRLVGLEDVEVVVRSPVRRDELLARAGLAHVRVLVLTGSGPGDSVSACSPAPKWRNWQTR